MTAETAEPMRCLTEVAANTLRCLWLTRVDPVTLDAGDLTYSFHLLSSLSRSGVRLSVLALRRAGDRSRRAAIDNGVEWFIVPLESDRALILGSAVWLAKQMNLIEFLATVDELFYQMGIELWVDGNVPDHLRVKNHFHATRFLGFVADLEPIFSSVRIGIVAERTGGGFKLKTLDYIFNRLPIAAIRGSHGWLTADTGAGLFRL
jgi:hypothetical protein